MPLMTYRISGPIVPQQSIHALFPALRQQRCDLLLLHIAAPFPNVLYSIIHASAQNPTDFL